MPKNVCLKINFVAEFSWIQYKNLNSKIALQKNWLHIDGMSLTYIPSLKKKLMQFEKAGAKIPLIVSCLFQFVDGDHDSLHVLMIFHDEHAIYIQI